MEKENEYNKKSNGIFDLFVNGFNFQKQNTPQSDCCYFFERSDCVVAVRKKKEKLAVTGIIHLEDNKSGSMLYNPYCKDTTQIRDRKPM